MANDAPPPFPPATPEQLASAARAVEGGAVDDLLIACDGFTRDLLVEVRERLSLIVEGDVRGAPLASGSPMFVDWSLYSVVMGRAAEVRS